MVIKCVFAVPSISEISMEVAEQGHVTAVTPPARLIERCDCPPGYSGFSCEVSWSLPACLSPALLPNQTEILSAAAVSFTSTPTLTLFYMSFLSQ